jgi:hypothetical protein
MTVLSVAEAEERVRLAQDALSAANIRKNAQSINLHSYRVMKAEEALTKARHREESPNGICRCHLCSGRFSWDD